MELSSLDSRAGRHRVSLHGILVYWTPYSTRSALCRSVVRPSHSLQNLFRGRKRITPAIIITTTLIKRGTTAIISHNPNKTSLRRDQSGTRKRTVKPPSQKQPAKSSQTPNPHHTHSADSYSPPNPASAHNPPSAAPGSWPYSPQIDYSKHSPAPRGYPPSKRRRAPGTPGQSTRGYRPYRYLPGRAISGTRLVDSPRRACSGG